MPNEIVAALIGVAGALAGAWLGGRISRHASRELLQQQSRAEFSASFAETLSKLYLGHEQEHGFAVDLLNSHFPHHYSAYQKLRSVLPASQRSKLDKRWDEYTGDKKYELPEERDMYRFCELFDQQTAHEQNMAAINRVNRLLQEA